MTILTQEFGDTSNRARFFGVINSLLSLEKERKIHRCDDSTTKTKKI